MKKTRKVKKTAPEVVQYISPPREGSAAQRHVPVLYNEVLSFFEPCRDFRILDGTLGLGGHSEGMLRKVQEVQATGCALLGLDRDCDALQLAQERLAPFSSMVTTLHSCFADFAASIDGQGLQGWEWFDFALIDIGVSSMQIDAPERGFSFLHDGPLDMRMDASMGQSAACIVNRSSVAALKEMLHTYGEEPLAGKIARKIDDARAQRPIETTLQLASIVESAYPVKWRVRARNHPATRTFQALRMVVNDELGQLSRFLEEIVPRMRPGGRIAVITFHSLEDRIVKHFFRDQATGCKCPPHIPMCVCGNKPALTVLTRKAVLPSAEEITENSRAGSAKLRVAEKIFHGV